jgi:hypothetical protein
MLHWVDWEIITGVSKERNVFIFRVHLDAKNEGATILWNVGNFTSWKGVTYQKTRIFSNIAVWISNSQNTNWSELATDMYAFRV